MAATTKSATVNEANAYHNIITNFSDPLEVMREAISNAIDARASKLRIIVDDPIGPTGTRELRIRLEDNGTGMAVADLERFFNLGDTLKGDNKKRDSVDEATAALIGEKGFGTKIYLNSRKVEVTTTDAETQTALKATSTGHLERIYEGKPPAYEYESISDAQPGTRINILGYNHNDGELFNQDRVRDYLIWFTKFASFEPLLWDRTPSKHGQTQSRLKELTIELRALGFDSQKHGGAGESNYELVRFGHQFPEECYEPARVKEKARSTKASFTDVFCRRFVDEGTLKNHPGVKWQAAFSIEGNRVKYSNAMVRRQGYKAPPGAYKVGERYGIWLCKDFIPVEQVNFLVNTRGSEHTKYHAFFNCQELRLSADRTSIGPTDPKIRTAVFEQIKEKVREIMEDERVEEVLSSLNEEEKGERTTDQEKKHFTKRLSSVKKAARAHLQGLDLFAPKNEQAVVAMLAQILTLKDNHLPFRVLDWNGSEGLDILARDTSDLSLEDASKFYVECKHTATSSFNHSLSNVKYIVCWTTDLENDSEVNGIGGDKRRVAIKSKSAERPYTQYFLVRDDAQNNIELIVLKRFVAERLACEFRDPL